MILMQGYELSKSITSVLCVSWLMDPTSRTLLRILVEPQAPHYRMLMEQQSLWVL